MYLENYLWICANSNTVSRKWLRPTCSLVISLIPLWCSLLKTLLGVGLITFWMLFLKALKLPTFPMLWSRLFHSITAEGKKEILTNLCFALKRGTILDRRSETNHEIKQTRFLHGLFHCWFVATFYQKTLKFDFWVDWWVITFKSKHFRDFLEIP